MLDRLIASRQLQQAIDLGEQLRIELPNSIHVCLSLSEAYRQRGQFNAAKECAAHAYQIESNDGFVCAQYARTLVPFADYKTIKALLLRHESRELKTDWVEEMMGAAAASVDEWQLAITCYDRLLLAQPGHLHARYMRGLALSVLGFREDAVAEFQNLIRRDPGYGRAWWSLADIDLSVIDEKQLLSLLANKQLPESEKIYLWQVSGQLQQRACYYEAAFESWGNANRIRRDALGNQQGRWNNMMNTLLNQAESFSGAAASPSLEKPVFIVGLPRSGSTLVEQLISNSGEIAALGELRDMEVLIQKAMGLEPMPLPFGMDMILAGGIVPEDIAHAYSQRARSRCPDGLFCDKNPANFMFLGIILQAFPNARIIHVYKHPMDACLGAFKHQFAAAAPWSYSLDDIAHFYSVYHKMMSAWERLYPGRICHLSYEKLMQHTDKETQRVFSYCGLTWTNKVMDLTQKVRPVLSASANQVREGVHVRALFAHKNFRIQLEPFRRALIDRGLNPDVIWEIGVNDD